MYVLRVLTRGRDKNKKPIFKSLFAFLQKPFCLFHLTNNYSNFNI